MPKHRYFRLSNYTTLHPRMPFAMTNSCLDKCYKQLNNQELNYSVIGRRKWASTEIHMLSFPLRCASVLYPHPNPLISWMASCKKTLFLFISWGLATGGNTNKFIRTYPDYPPAVCFQLTHEMTRLLATESSLLFNDHICHRQTYFTVVLEASQKKWILQLLMVFSCSKTFCTLQIYESDLFGCDSMYARIEKLFRFSRLIQELTFPW